MIVDKVFLCAILCVYMAGTPGTWFGLPDFQITEGLAQAGILPNNSTYVNPQVINPTGTTTGPTFPTAKPTNKTGGGGSWGNGEVLGDNKTITDPKPDPNPTPSGPGDSELQILAKTDRNPSQESRYQELLRQQGPSQDEINSQINDVYNPTMNYLNQAETAVRDDFPNVLDAAQKSYELAIQELTGSKERNLTTIGENTLQAGTRKEDALSSARRLYDELRRGYSQRFGGSTSAGQAATELASVEQQRQMGATGRQYSDTVRQIEQQKVQLEQDYSLGQQKIMESKSQAIAQANRDFQNKLLEISGKRAETESAKAQAKLSALQELRNRAYQAQQEALNYQQNLDMFYKQQQADLTTYAQKLQMAGQGSSTAINSFLGNTTTNPSSTLQVGSSGGQNTAPTLAGIKTSREDELRGAINQKIDPYGIQKMLYGN